MIQGRGLSTLIQIDGGVNQENIDRVARAGADCFVAGSAIFGTDNYKQTIDSLREKIQLRSQ